MAFNITFRFPDTTTFDASTLLKKSVTVKEAIHSNTFESTKNTCSFDLVFDNTLLTKIESASGFVTVEVKDGATWVFNGILQPINELSFKNTKDTLSMELVDRGVYLDYNLTAPKFYNGKTVKYIVEDISSGSGITYTFPARANASTSVVQRGQFKTDKSVWEFVKTLLKEFNFSLYFATDGTAIVKDLIVNVPSTVTVDDTTNTYAFDGSISQKKTTTKGRSEKVSVQASWQKIVAQTFSVVDFTTAADSMSGKNFSPWLNKVNTKYYTGVGSYITGGQAKILDSHTFDFSAPKTSSVYLGVDNINASIEAIVAIGYPDAMAATYSGLHSLVNLEMAGGVITSVKVKQIQSGLTTYTTSTLSPSDYTFSMTTYADRIVLSFAITNAAYLVGYNSRAYSICMLRNVTVDGTVYLGEVVEPIKITNPKSIVENYSLSFAQKQEQVQDYVNFKSDVSNNRNWTTNFESYNNYALGTGITVNMIRRGVSSSGVIVGKDSKFYPTGRHEFRYSIVNYNDLTLTAPVTPNVIAPTVYYPPATDDTGTFVKPVQVSNLPNIDYTALAESDFLIHKEEVGFWDVVANEFTFQVTKAGKFKLGKTAGNKLTWDPATGDLSLTGTIYASAGSFSGAVTASTLTANTAGNIAGWLIEATKLKSASSGERIELDKSLNRISIIDAAGSTSVAMGFLQGLINPVDGSTLPAGTRGFWVKAGEALDIKGTVNFSGSQIVKDSSLDMEASGVTRLKMGIYSGEKGFFTFNASGVLQTKLTETDLVINKISAISGQNLHLDASAAGGIYLNYFNQTRPVFSYGYWRHYNTIDANAGFFQGLEVAGNVVLSGTTGVQTAPKKFNFSNDYTNSGASAAARSATKDQCKLYFYDGSATERYGLGVGSFGDIFHQSQAYHDFYIANSRMFSISSKGLGIAKSSSSSPIGISLWNDEWDGSNLPQYGLFFGGTATFGTYGSVLGGYATYFTTGNSSGFGWIFKNTAVGNVLSIDNYGNLQAAGTINAQSNLTCYGHVQSIKPPVIGGTYDYSGSTGGTIYTAIQAQFPAVGTKYFVRGYCNVTSPLFLLDEFWYVYRLNSTTLRIVGKGNSTRDLTSGDTTTFQYFYMVY